MAKRKQLKPDADSILHTGIYKRRVGPISVTEWRDMAQQDAQEPITPEEWRKQLLAHLDNLISTSDQEEEVFVAKDVRRALLRLKHSIKIKAGHEKLIEASILLGRWLEHLDIQPLESATLCGRDASTRGSLGAGVTNARYIEKQARYQAAVEDVMDIKALSYTEATIVVGEKYGVSGRTVQNHTNNPDTQ